jgi:hypothetical protein
MALQDPRLKRVGPFSLDDGSAQMMPRAAAPAPAAPAAPALRRPNPLFDDSMGGVRDVVSSVKSGAKALDAGMDRLTRQPQPIAWNLTPTHDRMGFPAVAYGSTPTERPTLRPMPRNLYRPRTGPQSAAEVGRVPPVTARPVPAAVPALTSPAAPAASTPAPIDPNYDPAADNISAANLAAASRLTRPVAPTAATSGGVDVGGRHLPYGGMVNGVPTFSDGTGSIPNTMTPEAMARLASAPSIGRADVGALGHALASDALGGPVSSQQMVQQNLTRLEGAAPITGSRPSAEQFAASDRNAIALRDPRSAAGIAARNLSVEAGFARTPRLRRLAADQLAAFQTGTQRGAELTQQGDQAQALQTQQGEQALAQTAAQGQNTLANTALEQTLKLKMPRAGEAVTLDDNTLALRDPITGVITRSTLPDGTVAKGLPKSPAPPIYTSAGGQAALQAMTNSILGINPNTGMIEDKNAEGGARVPTGDETYAAMQKAQQQLQSLGQGSRSSAAPPKVGAVEGGYRFKGGDPANSTSWEKV